MNPSGPTVLVLDGWTAQALACVRSLGRAGYRVLVASDRRSPLAAWSRYCHGRFRLTGETLKGFASLREWASGHEVRIVLPLTERACVLCNLERERWETNGMALGCADQDTLQQAFDKYRTLEAARAVGVATPPTYLPKSEIDVQTAAAALGFPCVVKSRFSNAWDGNTFLPNLGPAYASDPAELTAVVAPRRQGPHWPLLQGFVPGQGKGVFALFDHGRAIAWFAHERLRDVRPSGSGSSLRRSAPLEPRLREPAQRLLEALQWHGPAMVEFRDDGVHPPVLMEVNGRFWGSLQLAVSAGADFPRWWATLLGGRPVEEPTTYEVGVTVRWLWGDVKRFLYVLAGAPPGYPGRYPTVRQGVQELLGTQPPGTLPEAWQPGDRWPGIGEWVQGMGELWTLFWHRLVSLRARSRRMAATRTASPSPPQPPVDGVPTLTERR